MVYNNDTKAKEVSQVDVGAKIKNARQAKGMTQEELGEMLGVQKSAIAKYENGRVVNIKRSTLKKISDVLGIPPFELVFDEKNGQAAKDSELSARKKAFMQKVEGMSDAQIERLEQILALVENKEL
jgi:transcriptional regulator with XRE-family HTH domain